MMFFGEKKDLQDPLAMYEFLPRDIFGDVTEQSNSFRFPKKHWNEHRR